MKYGMFSDIGEAAVNGIVIVAKINLKEGVDSAVVTKMTKTALEVLHLTMSGAEEAIDSAVEEAVFDELNSYVARWS